MSSDKEARGRPRWGSGLINRSWSGTLARMSRKSEGCLEHDESPGGAASMSKSELVAALPLDPLTPIIRSRGDLTAVSLTVQSTIVNALFGGLTGEETAVVLTAISPVTVAARVERCHGMLVCREPTG